MTRLNDFREQYPQYNDLDDETLAESLRMRHYQDMDPAQYREMIGLPSLDATKPPTLSEKINAEILSTGAKVSTILSPGKDDLSEFSGETQAPEVEQRPSLTDLFFSGVDQYRADLAAQSSLDTISDLQEVEDIARGRKDKSLGGPLGVSGSSISNYARSLRADAGDPTAAAEMQADIDTRREQLIGQLQGSIDRYQETQRRAERIPYSPSTQRVVGAQTFGEGLEAFTEEPFRIMTELFVRSAPNSAEALTFAVAGGVVSGGLGFAAGMGMGAGRTEFRNAFAEALRNEGIDLTDARSLFRVVDDQDLMDRVRNRALTRAGIIGAASALSGGVATKNLTPFVKNTVAQGITNAAAQTVVQTGLEAGGEAAAQLATEGEIAPGEVLAEALGSAPTAIIDVGVATVTGVKAAEIQRKTAKLEAELEEILGEGQRETTPTTTEPPPPEAPPPETEPPAPAPVEPDPTAVVAEPEAVTPTPEDIGPPAPPPTEEVLPPTDRRQAPRDDPDRRQNAELRKRFDELTEEQKFDLVYRNELTGLPNRRAFEEALATRTQQAAAPPKVPMPKEIQFGPAFIKTKPIGGTLYRETSPERLGVLLRESLANTPERGAVRELFVTDNRDLALGQADNVGASITFDGDYVSGRVSPKPIPGELTGKEYVTDFVGHEAIREFTLPAGTQLKGLVKTFARKNFTRELGDTVDTYTRRVKQPARPLSIASVDADSLKFVNDNLGPDAGDALLIAVGEALQQEGAEAFHISGDEFYVIGDTEQDVQASLNLANAILAQQKISSPKGHLDGPAITYGIGQTKEQADQVLKDQKVSREKAGKRAPRGTAPPGTILSAKPATLDMQAGTNYVPMIGNRGNLPIDPNHQLVLGNGRRVRIPKQPVRREHIIHRLQQDFGLAIYQGRVRGKLRLGFYRVGQGEVRIKNANDIEVAAHEVAHWLDDRHPWISRLYNQYEGEMKGVSYDSTDVVEGYAEFMRLYMTQESEAMHRAPGFYDAWTTALAQRQDLQTTIFDLQELMHAWTMQGARARLASKHGTSELSFFEKVRAQMVPDGGFVQSALDGLRSIKRAEIDINGDQETIAYNKLRLAIGGSNATMESAFYYGTPGWRPDGQGMEYTGDSLRQIFGNHWGSENLALYMMARRGQELMQQGRENLMRPDEIAAGLALETAYPEFPKMFKELQGFWDRMLDFYEGAGILNAESRAQFQLQNAAYVPFNRIVDTAINGRRATVRNGGNPFQRLRGGTQNVNNLYDNIINNTGMLIRMAMVNDGKREIYQTIAGAQNQQGGIYAAPIASDIKPVNIDQDQVLRTVVEAMGMDMKTYRIVRDNPGMAENDEQAATVYLITQMAEGMEEMVTFFRFGVDPTGQVDYYMDAGKKKWFEIHDRGLLESMQFMGPQPSNWLLTLFGGFSAVLRRGTVAVPVFQIKNFIRDTTNAWLLSDHQKVPAARALRVVMSRLEADPDYQEMMVNGGGFANRSQGLEAQRRMIIDPTRWTAIYDRLMGRFENANRLAEYKAARAAGEPPRRAALLSREISTDFAMRGASQVMRGIAVGVPFLNARMQGLYRIARQFSTRDLVLSYAWRGGLLMTAGLALYALNKDDERYKELPEDIKDLYWVFFTGEGEDEYFLVPKPFESGMIFGTMPERMFELVEQQDGKEFADAMLWMATSTFHADLTPQIFKPWLELAKNKNWAGSPIVPFYLENVDPGQQYRYYTTETMKQAGEKLGLSPVKTEHVFRGYMGTLGTYLLAASDATIRAATDEPVERPTRGETWRENIIVKAVIDPLVGEGPPRRTKYVQDLYDMVKKAEQKANTTQLLIDRQNEEVNQYVKDPDNARLIGINPVLSEARTKLAEINSAMDNIRMSKDLTGDQKRLQLWELTRQRNALARQVVTEIKKQEATSNPY